MLQDSKGELYNFKNDKSSNQINHFWDLQVKRHNVEMEIKLLEAKNKLLMKEQVSYLVIFRV